MRPTSPFRVPPWKGIPGRLFWDCYCESSLLCFTTSPGPCPWAVLIIMEIDQPAFLPHSTFASYPWGISKLEF